MGMTINEAIKVLRTESIELGGAAPSVCRFLEALDMAVKVLVDVPDKDVGKWIRVEDRMPEHGTRVLVCDIYAHNRYIGVWFFEKDPDDGSDCWEECGGGWQPLDAVTHWMPLPELPKEDDHA